MDLIKDAKRYWDEWGTMKAFSIDHYIDDKGFIYGIAFRVCVFFYAIGLSILPIPLYILSPLWILPYIIYRIIRGQIKEKERRN